MSKLYFAHPISSYGSEQEKRIIEVLSQKYDVVNPSDKRHQDKVLELRSKFNDRSKSSKEIMNYFVDVCNSCDSCAVLTFPTGELGAGTVMEAQSFLDRGGEVFKIIEKNDIISLEQIKDLSKEKCLTVEDTRIKLKTYMPSYS